MPIYYCNYEFNIFPTVTFVILQVFGILEKKLKYSKLLEITMSFSEKVGQKSRINYPENYVMTIIAV